MNGWAASAADINAIVAARHADPFAGLGPHDSESGVAVRAFVPGAERLWLMPESGAPQQFTRRHPQGFFELLIPSALGGESRGERWKPGAYRLKGENAGGAWEFRDPYAFASVLGALDDYLLIEGTHRLLYQRLGAQLVHHQGVDGVNFSVWAPNASRVSVVGDFNGWDGRRHTMRKRIDSGLW